MKHISKSKTALATLASLGAASSAQAAITDGVSVLLSIDISNVGLAANDGISWDIDGVGGPEAFFSLNGSVSEGSFQRLKIVTSERTTGFSFLTSESALQSVGTAYAVGSLGLFGAGLLRSTVNGVGSSNLLKSGTPSPMTIGFKFKRSGQTHYGIADFSYTFVPGSGASLELQNVKWNDVAGQGITGSGVAVPEPAAAATGLGLLALGAVGLRRMRRDRKS